MAGVFTAIACGSSDAHLNPAVTLGFAARAGDFSKVGPYFVAQMLGRSPAPRWCGCTTCRTGRRHRMACSNAPAFAPRLPSANSSRIW